MNYHMPNRGWGIGMDEDGHQKIKIWELVRFNLRPPPSSILSCLVTNNEWMANKISHYPSLLGPLHFPTPPLCNSMDASLCLERATYRFYYFVLSFRSFHPFKSSSVNNVSSIPSTTLWSTSKPTIPSTQRERRTSSQSKRSRLHTMAGQIVRIPTFKHGRPHWGLRTHFVLKSSYPQRIEDLRIWGLGCK